MAEQAVTFLLENLGKLLVEQIKLVSGAEKDFRRLQQELETMKTFLLEATNKLVKEKQFRQYERQVREAVYEAEDTIDACLTLAAASANKKSFSIRNLTKRLDLANEVRTIRNNIQDVFSQARMGFDKLPVVLTAKPNPQPFKRPSWQLDNLVGFDDEVKTLIKRINENPAKMDVISIIGMPGIGKTTLARRIYEQKKTDYDDSSIFWVPVSQDHNIREVFRSILKKRIQNDISMLEDHELVDEVRNSLQNSKFLLFLDDIWSCEAWDHISTALPKENGLGKVIITSRNEHVARLANPTGEPHKLRFLTQSESWELLQLQVFGKIGDCRLDPDLDGLVKSIAKQCGGVPLAIVVIGGILLKLRVNSNVKDEWEKVSKSVSAHQLSHDEQKRTENIILLSYNQLPQDLRDCFVYLGLFPEGTEIPTWKLIRLWIAEGFIQLKADKNLEEVAEDNLKELVARNLVIADKFKATGEIKVCRIHDMIREFCIRQAAFESDNFFQEVKFKEGEFYPATSEISMSRRLCIHSYVVDFLQKRPKGRYVRSFLCFSEQPINLQKKDVTAFPEAFEPLRVLDVNPIQFPLFPSEITNFLLLRYIVLSGDTLNTLPKAVLKLWNLQTIRIDTKSRKLDIEADISKMMQLRHFKTKAAILVKKMKGISENLQTLSRLAAHCRSFSDVINKSPNLKILGIRGKLDDAILEAKCLEKLNHLRKLKLVHDVFPGVNAEKPLRCLPQPERFPPNLKILKLSSTYLKWNNMTTLASLGNLEVLKLKEYAFVGKNWNYDGREFPALHDLHIDSTDLQFWSCSDNPFRKLKCLVLKNCKELEEIPSVLEKSLQVLDIEPVNKSIAESWRAIEMKKREEQLRERGRGGGFKLIVATGDGR